MRERPPEPRFLAVGQVVGAHGLRGELKVEVWSDDPRRFGLLRRVFLGLEDEEPVPWPLAGYRMHKRQALLQLAGCRDRTQAEALRGQLVQVPMDEAIPLEEDQYFEHQIMALEVWTVSGDFLGTVQEIIHTGANEVYVVRSAVPSPRETLIPAISDVVLKVDLEAGQILVELPQGLE